MERVRVVSVVARLLLVVREQDNTEQKPELLCCMPVPCRQLVLHMCTTNCAPPQNARLLRCSLSPVCLLATLLALAEACTRTDMGLCVACVLRRRFVRLCILLVLEMLRC